MTAVAPRAERGTSGPQAPIFDVMSMTRAIRRLAPEPVPSELLRTIVPAAVPVDEFIHTGRWSQP